MRERKHKVIVNGTPKLENMPKDAFKVFCSSFLSEIEDYYKEKDHNSINIVINKDKTQSSCQKLHEQ